MRNINQQIDALENRVANLQSRSPKITGTTTELTATGRPTAISWEDVNSLILSVNRMFGGSYVIIGYDGYDRRIEYNRFSVSVSKGDIVFTASPSPKHKKHHVDVVDATIRASLRSILGHGADMPEVVSAFLSYVKSEIPFAKY